MKITKILFAALGMATAVGTASAQIVIEATSATLQAQIGRDENGFSSCGIRALVLDADTKDVDAYDFSIVIRPTMYFGLMKAGKSHANLKKLKDAGDMKGVTPAPIMFWIAEEQSPNSVRMDKIIQAENKGFILGSADLAKSYEAVIAIAAGKRMQFVTRYANQKLDRVIGFSGKLSDKEVAPLASCLQKVMAKIGKQAEEELAKMPTHEGKENQRFQRKICPGISNILMKLHHEYICCFETSSS